MSRNLVFEIGTEEIPSAPLYGAIEQLRVTLPTVLREARLEYGEVAVFATPRRIAILVSDLAERQEDRTVRAKGPALKAAFDADGNPTKAAEGFARGKGVSVDSLERVEDDGGSYVYAVIDQRGEDATAVLPGLLGDVVTGIEWPKAMRWGSGDVRFSRPVRWLAALFGGDVVDVRVGDLTAGRITYGHRFQAPGAIELPNAEAYPEALAEAMVVLDQNARAGVIREGIAEVAESLGGQAVVPEKVFAEVVNLAEWPTVASGTFDEEFLAVPREVLENAMGSHQRYFPVESADGELLNRFIVVHNGDPARTDAIVRGHERVIRARLADAAFFYHEDLQHTLEEYVERLAAITFQEKLGTLLDKTNRIESLAGKLGALLQAPADEIAFATRAAHLAKADLVTSAVVEFTSLQGVMGGYYAIAGGEERPVAEAIVDHYLPRFAGDMLPRAISGRLTSVADKMDTIVGIFAIGLAPTGSADPYALRRSAIGVLQMQLGGTRLTLDETIAAALEGYDAGLEIDVEKVGAEVKAFIVGRLEGILRERGQAYDTVDAVLAVAADDPADALARCEALTAFRAASDDMEDLSVAFTRAKNLAQRDLGDGFDTSIMGVQELALATALNEARDKVGNEMGQHAYSAVLETFAGLRGPIDAFFEDVLVMDEDLALRENRLRLLNRFVDVFVQFADFSKLVG